MSTPFIGQIILFAGNFEPAGWAFCDGRQLSIAENGELFAAIGTTYGGDGETTFALPDLRSHVPIGMGQGPGTNYARGETVGVENVTLTLQQMPAHNHAALAFDQPGTAAVPANNMLSVLGGEAGNSYRLPAYAPPGQETPLNAVTVSAAGGSQPHNNLQPYQAVNYCICLYGAPPTITDNRQLTEAMSEPFVAQIAMFGFGRAPLNWALCNGQLMPISRNTALFSLIGTVYGGDGRTTFALPNLQGSAAIGAGQGAELSAYSLGQTGGEAAVALVDSELPFHAHHFSVSPDPATSPHPQGNLLARGAWTSAPAGAEVDVEAPRPQAAATFYSPNPSHASTALAPGAVAPAGSSQPHNNMQPYLALNFCIALQGIFPPRG